MSHTRTFDNLSKKDQKTLTTTKSSSFCQTHLDQNGVLCLSFDKQQPYASTIAPASYQFFGQSTGPSPYIILTFEYDDDELISDQLTLFRAKPKKPPIEAIFNRLRAQFHDLRAISCVYSGNKSVHYHFAISTAHVKGQNYKEGHRQAHHRLGVAFAAELQSALNWTVDQANSYDPAMASIHQLRRLPLGYRPDTALHQNVLFECIRKTAGSGARSALLDNCDFDHPQILHSNQTGSLSEGLIKRIADRLDELYEGWPQLSHITQNPLKAHFYNDPTDNNPASIMYANSNAVMMNGGSSVIGPRMQMTLLDLVEQELEADHFAPIQQTEVEAQFSLATTHRAARAGVWPVLQSILSSDAQTSLITGHEGLGKTSAAIQNLQVMLNGGDVLFSFPNYDLGREKIASIRTMFGSVITPILIEGQKRLIKSWMAKHKFAFNTLKKFADDHLIEAVMKDNTLRNGLIAYLRRELGTITGDVVFVTVHAVTERLDSAILNLYREALDRTIDIKVRIIDEVTVNQLVDLITPTEYDALNDDQKVGYELIDGHSGKLPDYCTNSETYDFKRYFRVRKWWKKRGQKTILLTAETVPSLVSRAVGIETICLALPEIEKDRIDVMRSNNCKKNIDKHISDQIEISPAAQMISNSSLLGDVTNHANARGRNDLMNRDIISFVNPASPALLINMAILGCHLGLASLPELTIIDEMSQTAGRNKGFRSGGCDHVMIINHYVWAFISPAIRNARYRFAINEEAVHRRDRKAA